MPLGSRQAAPKLGIAAVCASFAAACALPALASAAINVYTPERTVLASFATVDCSLTKVRGERRFVARASKSGSRLIVVIFPGDFVGFRTYQVLYGGDSPVDVVWGRGARAFANYNRPEPGVGPMGPRLTVAGGVGFPTASAKRRTVRVGLPIVYDSPTSGDWVSIVGRARCASR